LNSSKGLFQRSNNDWYYQSGSTHVTFQARYKAELKKGDEIKLYPERIGLEDDGIDHYDVDSKGSKLTSFFEGKIIKRN